MGEPRLEKPSLESELLHQASSTALLPNEDGDGRGHKRKQPAQGRSFKVIGHMVLAMQRFKGAQGS